MSVKVILFDFDGTLADTLTAIVKISNSLAGEFGYQPTSAEKLEQVRHLSSREIIKQSGISRFKIPFLLKKVQKLLRQDIQSLTPIPGLIDVLNDLKDEGYQLGILTSNSADNVNLFLENNSWVKLFDFVDSGSPIFGKEKVIRKFLKKHNLNPADVIYVGDETRDIEAAKKNTIKVVAVSWGFNYKEVLTQYQPDFLIDEPQELSTVVSNLDQSKVKSKVFCY